jgi:hypothetical protein
MDIAKLQKLLKSAIKNKSKTKQTVEDLQYNLTTFLNEDIYVDDFELEDTTSLFWINFFEKNKLIFIAEKDGRILLTPVGETLLIEINYLLLYID